MAGGLSRGSAHPTSVHQVYNEVLSLVSFQLSEEEEQLTADLCSLHMQDFEDKGQEGTQQQRGLEDKKPYHFNKRESQIMRIAVDTMHMAGMALVCQGFAIFLMGAHAQPAVCSLCANEPASGRPRPPPTCANEPTSDRPRPPQQHMNQKVPGCSLSSRKPLCPASAVPCTGTPSYLQLRHTCIVD